MRQETLDMLCVPNHPEDRLVLSGGDLTTGELSGDGVTYPIVRGIPRILPVSHDARTRKTFSAEWSELEVSDTPWGQDLDAMSHKFTELLGVEPGDLSGKWVLDVGCGGGRISACVAKQTGARMVAIDVSTGLEIGNSLVEEGVHCDYVQTDAQFPPFQHGSFDFIHASGSVHHTPNPEKTFAALVPLLKSGGVFGLLLYTPQESKSLRHHLRRSVKNVVSPMPLPLQTFVVHAISLFTLVKQTILVRVFHRPEKVPFIPRLRHHRMMARDMYTVRYDYHFTREDIQGWFDRSPVQTVCIEYIEDTDARWLVATCRAPAQVASG